MDKFHQRKCKCITTEETPLAAKPHSGRTVQPAVNFHTRGGARIQHSTTLWTVTKAKAKVQKYAFK